MARKGSILSVAVLTLAAVAVWSSSRAFVPGAPQGRRELLQGVAGAIAAGVGSQAAWADAYGSKPWALTKYAPFVLGLKDDVEGGNMRAVLEREGKFKALNGYWMFSPQEYAAKNQLVSDLMSAAENSDKGKVQELYNQYTNDKVLNEWAARKPRKQGKMMTVQSALFSGQSTLGSVEGRGI